MQTIVGVLAAELYVMTHVFDIGVVIKTILGKISKSIISLILFTDLKFIYKCLVTLNTI